MKFRHEHLTILLIGLVCILLIQVYLLRSALVAEQGVRERMDNLHTHHLAVNTAKLMTATQDYAELHGRVNTVQRKVDAAHLVFREIGLLPVQIRSVKVKRHKKPK